MKHPVFSKMLVALAFGLAACSNLPATPQHFQYSLTVKITPSDSPATLEARHNAHVVAWQPESGFAVLGSNTVPAKNDALLAVADNQDNVSVPELVFSTDGPATPLAPNAVAGQGSSNGGVVAWTAGSSYWANGVRVWVGGDPNALPTREQNDMIWDDMHLFTAWSSAPQLGKGIKIAVIDTGVDTTHPALQNRLSDRGDWWDFVDNDNDPQEKRVYGGDNSGYGHGTGVAGLIVQVAPNAQIMPLRVLYPDGSGDELDLVAAIARAMDKGAKIINLSLGGYVPSVAVDAMIETATKRGVIVIASAGNNAIRQSMFPASKAPTNPNVLSVASATLGAKYWLGYNKPRASFSNYGQSISVVTPGESILTAYPNNAGKTWSGTSFSSALVSGSFALRLGKGPLGLRQNPASTILKGSDTSLFSSLFVSFQCRCGYLDTAKLQIQ